MASFGLLYPGTSERRAVITLSSDEHAPVADLMRAGQRSGLNSRSQLMALALAARDLLPADGETGAGKMQQATYEELSNYWNAILEVLPDLRRQPSEMRNHDIPEDNSRQYRDHLLFWPIGQELFAKVARSLLDGAQVGDGAEVSSLRTGLRPLAEVPWDLHHPPWRYLLLVPKTSEEESWRMRSEGRKEALEHAYHLLRWVVGLDPMNEEEKEELRAKWENLLLRPPTEADVVNAMWQEIEGTRARIATHEESV